MFYQFGQFLFVIMSRFVGGKIFQGLLYGRVYRTSNMVITSTLQFVSSTLVFLKDCCSAFLISVRVGRLYRQRIFYTTHFKCLVRVSV